MKKATIIQSDFFTGNDVENIARKLLGKILVFQNDSVRLAGVITETEAYAGITDRASHAFGNRRTKRTEVMYGEGGIAYVYLCYGIHSMLNIVTSTRGNPHAVLLRAIIPIEGISAIEKTMKRKINYLKDGIGPGRLTKLYGITIDFNGIRLDGSHELRIEDYGFGFNAESIMQGSRIGVDYALEDAFLPYRFRVEATDAMDSIKKAGLL